MSCDRRLARPLGRRAALAFLLATASALAACTVQPLHATGALSTSQGDQRLAAVAVEPGSGRTHQAVRNGLIRLFSGGAGEADAPTHRLAFALQMRVEQVARVDRPQIEDSQPVSSRLDMIASYTLTGIDGTVVARGSRTAFVFFDVPEQGFAERRGLRDAEDRAARELAEQLRLAVAAALLREGR